MPNDETPRHALTRLSDSDLTILDPAEDVRDRAVLDRDGEQIGTVDALFVDTEEGRVRFLDVGSGGFLGIGEQHVLLPVDAVTSVTDSAVRVDLARSRVAEAPGYDPDLGALPDTDSLYGWYGYSPYWATGYAYPMWAAPPR